MTVEQACREILGDDLADTLIADMGVRWAIVAAMAEATTAHNPEAIAALNAAKRVVR